MLQVDLKAAKVPYETADGVLDFHALRATYITELVRANTHPKIVQTLARHSEISLTMKLYTKLTDKENAAALDCLPRLPRMKGAPRAHQTGVRLSHIESAPVRSRKKPKQPHTAGSQRFAAAG
jgi:hypothetical protein